MRSDDELLAYVHQEATIRNQRRRRRLAGSAAVAAIVVLGLGSLVLAGDDGPEEDVVTEPGPTATSTEVPQTTELSTTSGTATTSAPTTPSTSPPPTTAPDTTTTSAAPPPIPQITEWATTGTQGIRITGTVTQDRTRPGWLRLDLRFESSHGSGPGALVEWGDGQSTLVGRYQELGGAECPSEINGEPILDPGEDPNAGVVDETISVEHQYPSDGATVRIRVDGSVSYCTTDGDAVVLNIDLTLGHG